MNIVDTVATRVKRSGAEFGAIGKSELGRDIVFAHVGGYAGKQIIITAGIHARECYTALVVLEQIERSAKNPPTIGGVYFVPLVNPDGALFFESGDVQGSKALASFAGEHKRWKANALGVDLNCNFDANWGSGDGNVYYPAPHGYVGEYPNSASEVAALVKLTDIAKPSATVSYHCMGGELYWEFFQTGSRRKRDELFAAAVAKHIGVNKVDGDLNSAGGYKDYCVMKKHIPAVTVELIASGEHPFSPSDFEPEIKKNADLPQFILDYLYWREA